MVGPFPSMAIPPGSDSPQCQDLVFSACNDELHTLCGVTDAATLKDRDRDTLVSKVLGAAVKLSQFKPLEADQKLADYETKLDSLINAPKPKISEGDANSLSSELVSARMCVDAVVSP